MEKCFWREAEEIELGMIEEMMRIHANIDYRGPGRFGTVEGLEGYNGIIGEGGGGRGMREAKSSNKIGAVGLLKKFPGVTLLGIAMLFVGV